MIYLYSKNMSTVKQVSHLIFRTQYKNALTQINYFLTYKPWNERKRLLFAIIRTQTHTHVLFT